MAAFGRLDNIQQHYSYIKELDVVFEYLRNAIENTHEIHKRIMALDCDQYEKVELSEDIFAIEQSYVTRVPEESFFESHQKYVDVQFMVQEQEAMKVQHIDKLTQTAEYNTEDDYTKYDVNVQSSELVIEAGSLALFFPYDGHMPAMQVQNTPQRIYKTVVKIPYTYFEK